ncbi:2-hydroxyacyl-CoA dehydratase subunit D [Chloroflexota bacterium]
MKAGIYPLEAQKLMAALQKNYTSQLLNARQAGKKVVWVVGQADTNLVVAMDYLPFYPENHNTICGIKGESLDNCLTAESHGYCPDLCSYARNNLGVIFSYQAKTGIPTLPKPDLLLLNMQCSTHVKWWETISRMYDVPILALDTPMLHQGLESDDLQSVTAYVRQQLEEHVTILERLTSKRLDYSRFQEVVQYHSQASRLFNEVLNCARRIPSPITAFDAFINLGPLMTLRGFPEAASYYKELLREVEDRVAQGFSAVGEEKHRLYWDNIPIWFQITNLAQEFAQYGACLNVAAYPFVWGDAFANLDPLDPFESIARSQLSLLLNNSTQWRIEYLIRLAKDFSVDGLIFQIAQTCKKYLTDQYAIAFETRKRTNLPSLFIEGDMLDSRLYSDEITKGQIQVFMESLDYN